MAEDSLDRARYSRQILLTGVGEEGQRALGRSIAKVTAGGLEGGVARLYATRAGFAAVEEGAREDAPSFVKTPAAREVIAGSLAALREIVSALKSG